MSNRRNKFMDTNMELMRLFDDSDKWNWADPQTSNLELASIFMSLEVDCCGHGMAKDELLFCYWSVPNVGNSELRNC